jgi:hypothetical protein
LPRPRADPPAPSTCIAVCAAAGFFFDRPASAKLAAAWPVRAAICFECRFACDVLTAACRRLPTPPAAAAAAALPEPYLTTSENGEEDQEVFAWPPYANLCDSARSEVAEVAEHHGGHNITEAPI